MSIYDALKDDHGKQRGLAAGLVETTGDSDERRRLFQAFQHELESHAAIEEMTLYKEMLNHDESQEQSRHSVAEHQEAAELLDELRNIDMSTNAWLITFKSLKDKLEHHLDEEEKDVFPLAQRLIGKSRARELGAEFSRMKERRMAG